MPQGANKIDRVGQRFGALMVVAPGPAYRYKSSTSTTWVCRCDCGDVSTKMGGHLTSGRTRSCRGHCPLSLQPLADRFFARIDKDGPVIRADLGPCWMWTGSREDRGYGTIHTMEKGREKTHRVAFYLQHGRWPTPGALHHCDNPPCSRWEHIYEGSPADNARDVDLRGRRRTRLGHVRPNPLAIVGYGLLDAGVGPTEVARQLGVDRHTVRNWKRLRSAWTGCNAFATEAP